MAANIDYSNPIDFTPPTNARSNFLDSLNSLIGSAAPNQQPLNLPTMHQFQAPNNYSPDPNLASFQGMIGQNATPSSAPTQASGANWGDGLLGVGGKLWGGIKTGMDDVGKVFNTGVTLGTDAGNWMANGIARLGDALGVSPLARDMSTGNIVYPHITPHLSDIQQQMHDIWSKPGSGDDVAQNIIGEGDPTRAAIGGALEPFLIPGEVITAPLSLAGKLGMEGLGRIPGISDWADSAAAKAAGNAFDAMPKAAPDAGAVDSVTVNPGDLQARPSGSGAIPQPSGQWPVPTQDFNFGAGAAPEAPGAAFDPMAAASDMRSAAPTPQLQPTSPGQFTFQPDVIPPNRIGGMTQPSRTIIDGEFSTPNGGLTGQPDFPQLQPTGMQPFTYNPEVMGGTNLPGRTAPIRNIVDGETVQSPSGMFPPTALQQAEAGAKASPEIGQFAGGTDEAGALARTTPEAEVMNPGNSNRINTQPPSNMQEGSYNPISSKDEYINQVMKNMSPGEKLSSAINGEFIQPIQNRVGQAMFKMGIGSGVNLLDDATRNAVLNNRGKLDAMDAAINDHMIDLATEAKQSGLSLNDLEQARNQYETGGIDSITNTNAKGIFQKLADANAQGIPNAQVGYQAEKAAGIDPKGLIDNYIHLSTERPTMFDVMRGAGRDGRNPVTQGYANERFFTTADAARNAGYNVRDSIASTADRLKESNRDLRNVELHNELANMSDKVKDVSDLPKGNMVKFQSQYGASPLNGKFVSPELNKYLKGLERQPLAQKDTFLGAAARNLDRLQGLYRTFDMYNPLVHSHNIIGNALMAFGLHPQNYADAERAIGNEALGRVLGGKANPAMQESLAEAQRTGALGSRNQDVFGQIKNILNPTLVGNVKQAHNALQDATLWNREKAMRLAVFHQARQEALARGLSANDAANVARDATNKHMVDYSNNNLSPIEQELWSRLDPFYKWHKGNYPLQFSKLADPAAMIRTEKVNNARDVANYAVSGHGQNQNAGGPNVKNNDVQWSNGLSFDPYMPSDEVNKVLNSRAGEFLWNRTSPFIKEAIQQATNHKYAPLQSMQPDGHDYRAATPMTNPANNLMEDLQQRLGHAAGSLAPQMLQNAFGIMNYDPEGYKVNPLARAGLGATGGFVNPNLQSPQSDNMQAKAELNFMQKALKQKLRGN